MSRTKGTPELEARLARAGAYLAKNAGPLCEEYAQRLRSYIGSNSSSLFDESNGMLASQTWQDDAVVKKSGASVEMGWGGASAHYGYVLERGPLRKNSWTYGPKNVLALPHGPSPKLGKYRKAGEPIMALRYFVKGKVVYRKQVTHVWNKSMLRPHWSKAIEANRGWFVAEWEKLTSQAMDH